MNKVGIEWVRSLPEAEKSTFGFLRRLNGRLTESAERVASPADFSGSAALVNSFDIVYYFGHGNSGGLQFGDGSWVMIGQMKLGSPSLKFVVFDACGVLDNGRWTDWFPVFGGLHYILGFSTDFVTDDTGMRGHEFAARLMEKRTVAEAWRLACEDTMDGSCVEWAYLRAFSEGIDTSDDHWLGCGPISGDPKPSDLNEMEYRSVCSGGTGSGPLRMIGISGELPGPGRENITLYRVTRSEVPIGELGFSPAGEIDRGERIVYDDVDVGHYLEIFKASSGLRRTKKYSQALAEERDQFNEEEREGLAQERAEAILWQAGLWTDAAKFNAVCHTQSESRSTQGERIVTLIETHVDFVFELDGLPIFGAGAKMRVSFRGPTEVSLHRFWRDPRPDGVADILTYAAALNFLKDDESMKGGEIEEIIASSLGYFACQPGEQQDWLIPVYAFQGYVSFPSSPPSLPPHRRGFLKYVQALRDSLPQRARVF